jgi:PIN domain nuclease of toxin-antitoxin system
VAAEPFRRLGVTWEHALRVGRLPAVHRDPFDRLLVAQALHESLVLVTRDARLARYGAAVLPA